MNFFRDLFYKKIVAVSWMLKWNIWKKEACKTVRPQMKIFLVEYLILNTSEIFFDAVFQSRNISVFNVI